MKLPAGCLMAMVLGLAIVVTMFWTMAPLLRR